MDRLARAGDDARRSWRLRRLALDLGLTDIKLRYRGSALGPFCLTLSTAVMVGSLGWLYGALFGMASAEYLPYLAMSQVLWAHVAAIVADACQCFVEAGRAVLSTRLPLGVFALRIAARNALALAHNAPVAAAALIAFPRPMGWDALSVVPALGLWWIDAAALSLALGALCARFRDVPPIAASVMQVAFFLTPVVWRPEQLGPAAAWLAFNPFHGMLAIIRAPLLGDPFPWAAWAEALAHSAALWAGAWLLFARARARIAYWL